MARARGGSSSIVNGIVSRFSAVSAYIKVRVMGVALLVVFG